MSLYRLYGPKVEVLDWRAQIEKRAVEAHAEIRAAGIAARRSIGQLLRSDRLDHVGRVKTKTYTHKFGADVKSVKIIMTGWGCGGGGSGKVS